MATTKAVSKQKVQVPEVLVTKFSELGVSEDMASRLLNEFNLPLLEVGPILTSYHSIKVTSADDKDAIQEARTTRLTLKRIRTGTEKTRKALKEESNKYNNAVQAIANYIKGEIEPAEEYLQLQEDFVKIQEEKAAAERVAKRTAILAELGADASIYSLGDMGQDAFDDLVTNIKDANEARALREKAEAEAAEKARLEDEARQKEIAEENARLKAEAIEREKQAAEEKAKIEATLAAERAAAEEQRKKAEAERVKREEIEAEQRRIAEEQKAAEIAVEEAKLEAERKAAMAPDREKVKRFSAALELVRTTKLPDVEAPEAKALVAGIDEAMQNLITRINEKATAL